jgi:hypothetical protein
MSERRAAKVQVAVAARTPYGSAAIQRIESKVKPRARGLSLDGAKWHEQKVDYVKLGGRAYTPLNLALDVSLATARCAPSSTFQSAIG